MPDSFTITNGSMTDGTGTGGDVWPIWCESTITGTASSLTSTCDLIWPNWVQGTGTAGLTTATMTTNISNVVWHEWCDPGNRVTIYGDQASVPSMSAQPARRNINEIQKKRRGRALLRSVLSQEQWEDWELHRSVRVEGESGDLYEVVDGFAYRLERGIVTAKFCWHGVGGYCIEDRIAAFILKLRTREAGFLRETHLNSFQEHEKRRVVLRREGRRRAAWEEEGRRYEQVA